MNEFQVRKIESLMESGEEKEVIDAFYDMAVTDWMDRETFHTILDRMLSRVEEMALQEQV